MSSVANTTLVRRLVTACVILQWTSVVPKPAGAQVRGTVVDAGGRALPLVVVVSRTRNGFLGTLTDVHGRFTFDGRPHAARDRIDVNALGFRPTTIRLRGDETEVTVTMEPDPTTTTVGWTVGLASTFDVAIVGSDGDAIVPGGSVITGRPYRIELTLRGQPDCTRPGPAPIATEPGRVTMAVGVYESRGGCLESTAPLVQAVEHVFDRAGPVELRLIGRWRDEIIQLVAKPAG